MVAGRATQPANPASGQRYRDPVLTVSVDLAASHQHARDLEFEEAAKLRDQVEEMRRVGLGFSDAKVS